MIDLPPDCQQALNAPLMQQIYQVESSHNPFAIGVVGGRLVRQPQYLDEAVATANNLAALGHNYSIGQGQVNKIHFERLGWSTDISAGFDVCTNVKAAFDIYMDCYNRAQTAGFPVDGDYSATHAALSCYYSGSFRAAQSNADVTRYVNEVLTTKPVNKNIAPNESLVIPLASNKSSSTPARVKALATPNKPLKAQNDWVVEGASVIQFD